MEKDRFKKLFPNLASEMDGNTSEADLQNVGEKEKVSQGRKWAGYEPDIIDFLRRCDKNEQAVEIIDYMETRGEINKKNSKNLLTRLLITLRTKRKNIITQL